MGNNVWFGGGVRVLPGFLIGDNVVIGAGPDVVHDIPANAVAVGNPCRVVRQLTQADALRHRIHQQIRRSTYYGFWKKVWLFPDAELPPVGVHLIPGHESITITNTSDQDANITPLYTDKEPVRFKTAVQTHQAHCLQTNEEAIQPCLFTLSVRRYSTTQASSAEQRSLPLW